MDLGIALLVMAILLVLSALVSGAEAAFFSLSPGAMQNLQSSKSTSGRTLSRLMDIPERLLATILIVNNMVNLGLIIIFAYFSSALFDFSRTPVLGFIVEVVSITLLIVFFGEILPKIYSIRYAERVALIMALPIDVAERLFRPLSRAMVRSTNLIQKKFSRISQDLSIDELSDALELTEQGITDEKNILQGIVNFGNKEVREVMTPRVDVLGVSIRTRFESLIRHVVDSGYSRIPVFNQDLDDIRGILYTKDLLPHLGKHDSFSWQSLIRPAYYVPETKRIGDLLREFQGGKIHMAVIIDEYGGTQGIITLEDILEEIVGEIADESDQEAPPYTRIDEFNFLFEGKVQLNDFVKSMNLPQELFEEVKGEAETLAGLILEQKGEMPAVNEVIHCLNMVFTIKSVDKRRIRQIQVTIAPKDEADEISQ